MSDLELNTVIHMEQSLHEWNLQEVFSLTTILPSKVSFPLLILLNVNYFRGAQAYSLTVYMLMGRSKAVAEEDKLSSGKLAFSGTLPRYDTGTRVSRCNQRMRKLRNHLIGSCQTGVTHDQ